MYIRVERVTGGLVLSGWFPSFKKAVEYAYTQRICLRGLNAIYQDLSHITLEGTDLRDSDFTGACLTNANLSHTLLAHANFDHADIADACFAGTKPPSIWICTKNSNNNENTTSGYIQKYTQKLQQNKQFTPENKRVSESDTRLNSYCHMPQRKNKISTRN